MWADNSMQAGGGGFLDQTYNGNATQSGKSEAVRSNSIVPLMIGHLNEQNPDSLNLWGSPIKLVQIVGFVKQAERLTTKASYEIVDETGSIAAFQWVSDDSEADLATVPEGSYARLIGSLREQGGQRHFFILNIVPIDSFTDVFEHVLEVMYACAKGRELFTQPEPGKVGMAMDVAESDGCNGMNKEQALVFRIIQSGNDTDTGVERSVLKSKIPADVRGKVDEILEFLVCEGHIYTTSTDDNFKTT